VNCRLLTAERLVTFLEELSKELAEPDRDALLLAFREILMNAMEHGGHFDPAGRRGVGDPDRAHDRLLRQGPGPGFDRDGLRHAAVSNPPDDPSPTSGPAPSRGCGPAASACSSLARWSTS